jgi:hypothetical protein
VSAAEIRVILEELIIKAQTIEPCLQKRLINLRSWINGKTDRKLAQKASVVGLLSEVILDSRFWLAIKTLTIEQRQQVYTSMRISPAEQYWFDVLFPLWFNEPDPKLNAWKRELMAGNFSQSDEQIIRDVSRDIELGGGSCIWRHTLDLSMATDLLATGLANNPLCVQITTGHIHNLDKKKPNWESTLKHWHIQRGLLISYNPVPNSTAAKRIAVVVLQHGDSLPFGCYNLDEA